MPLIVKPFTFVNGTVADALEVNANFDTLYNLVNGALDQDNLAAVLDFTAKTITFGPNTTFTDDLIFQAGLGAGFEGTLTHANTAPHTWTFPDSDGTVILITGTEVVPLHDHSDNDHGGDLESPTINTPTITVPIIADFTSANHDHLNAAGGGILDAAAIGSGTFADARISQSSVTQYSAAIAAAINLSDYTQRAADEIISGTWSFLNPIGINGAIIESFAGQVASSGTDDINLQYLDNDESISYELKIIGTRAGSENIMKYIEHFGTFYQTNAGNAVAKSNSNKFAAGDGTILNVQFLVVGNTPTLRITENSGAGNTNYRGILTILNRSS